MPCVAMAKKVDNRVPCPRIRIKPERYLHRWLATDATTLQIEHKLVRIDAMLRVQGPRLVNRLDNSANSPPCCDHGRDETADTFCSQVEGHQADKRSSHYSTESAQGHKGSSTSQISTNEQQTSSFNSSSSSQTTEEPEDPRIF